MDLCINLGYRRLCSDLLEYEIISDSFTFTTTLNSFSYTLTPPSTAPAIARVQHIFYNPLGLNYAAPGLEFRPGYNLISWSEFQKQTGDGYFLQTGASTSTIPTFATIDQGRQNIWFYPGTANVGDTVTVRYAPIPTTGTSTPQLVNETDSPKFPDDCCEAIVQWALVLLWQKAREGQMSIVARQAYDAEVKRIKQNYDKSHLGDLNKFDLFDWTSPIYPVNQFS